MFNDLLAALQSIAQLMDALNCGASLLDRSGTIIAINGSLCAMMKLPREQIVGRSVIDMYRTEEERQLFKLMVEGASAEEAREHIQQSTLTLRSSPTGEIEIF